MAKNDSPIQPESSLPKDLQTIDVQPIVPGVSNQLKPSAPSPIQAAPPQLGNYFSGPLTSDIQHDGQFIKTGYQTGSSIRTPLMPAPLVANPQNTAGIESIIREFVTISSPVSTIPGAVDALIFRGTWNDFTNYNISDVVLYSGFLYVAVASSLNVIPAGNPVSWTSLAGSGSVTSVALALPASVFNISGSPVLTTGTLTGTFANQSQNTVFAGLTSGAGVPSFRLLVAGDIPNLPASIITSGQLALARGGTHADLSATGGAHEVLMQTSSGANITVAQLASSDLTNYAAANRTAQVANVSATTVLAVTAAGLYRVSVYIVVSQAATVSSTMPDTQIIFTDQDSGATITIAATTSSTGNTTSTFAQATFVVNAKVSTNIQYAIGQSTAYVSSGVTPMQFAYRARVEYLG